MTTIIRETYQSVRNLARRPSLAITIVLTLALGIGSTAAVFSVVDAVFLRPLALKSPDRLIVIQESRNGKPANGNAARLADWRTQVSGLEAAAGFYSEKLALTSRGEAERVIALRSFGPIFSVLGIEPQLGRALTTEEESGRGAPVMLLSDGFWRRRFGGDAGLLGQTLNLDGSPYTVIGILPRQLDYPQDIDVLVPAPVELQQGSRKAAFLPAIARMKPGVRLREIDAQLETVADRLRRLYPATDRDLTARAVPLLESDTAESQVPVFALFGAVALVLLTACINVAGLLLARGAERRREASIRMSLGASRFAMLRLYLIECLLLGAAGCVGGLALAAFGLEGLKTMLPADVPRLATAVLNLRVTVFAAAISLACAVIFGTALASQSTKPSARAAFLVRRTLVAFQVALSLILLIGAGLLGGSFLRMYRTPLGFAPSNVLTINVSFPWNAPDTRVEAFRKQALESFSSLPGVISAGWGDRLPLGGGTQSGPIAVRDLQLPVILSEESTYHRAASQGYFQALGIPLRAGRVFETGKHEAVINETLSRNFFPEGGALGRFITFNPKPKANHQIAWLRIVGILGDVRQNSTDVAPPAEVYASGEDISWPLSSFVLRVQGDPTAIIPRVRQAVRQIDPSQVIDSFSTMDARLTATFREPALRTLLILAFGITALALTILGVYGVLSSEVTQRTREIGIRIAIGARPGQVVAMITHRSLRTLAAGIAAGLLGAAALTRFVASLLFGVKPLDMIAFLGAALLVAMTGCLASYLTARRAAGINPVDALRSE